MGHCCAKSVMNFSRIRECCVLFAIGHRGKSKRTVIESTGS
jgi:hypothetical protein